MGWWRMAQCSLPCLYTIVALPSGRATMTKPVIFMWFLLRDMIPMVSSSGTPGGQIGAQNNGCGYLPFIDWSRVVEAWVGVSRRALVDSCQPAQSCLRCW